MTSTDISTHLSAQQEAEQQLQVQVSQLGYCRILHTGIDSLLTLHYLFQFEVQIENQSQAGAQVLQVASTSQQDLQGISTVQFVQQGDLTEEQQQQVRLSSSTTPV